MKGGVTAMAALAALSVTAASADPVPVADVHCHFITPGYLALLEKHGALPENIHVKTVPGSFELIYGAHQMTLNDGYDAVIILGSVIRGETPHFDYICQGVTQGLADLNLQGKMPVIYGLLTCNTLEQAQERCGGMLGNKGDECAVTAIKMVRGWE